MAIGLTHAPRLTLHLDLQKKQMLRRHKNEHLNLRKQSDEFQIL